MAIQKPQFRRVRTPEGADFYGLPIGSLIVPGAISKAHALKGEGNAPKNALGDAGGPGDDPTWVKALEGPNKFTVGESGFEAPSGAEIFVSKNGATKIVRTKDGQVYVFSEKGAVNTAPALSKVLSASLDKPGAAYTKTDFDEPEQVTAPTEKASGSALADLPAGSKAVFDHGSMSLVKQDDGTWLNEEFDMSLTPDEVQILLDEGSVSIAEKKTEAAPEKVSPEAPSEKAPSEKAQPAQESALYSIHDKDYDGALATLKSAPVGTAFDVLVGDETHTFVKDSDGLWVSETNEYPYTNSGFAFARKSATPSEAKKPASEAKKPASEAKTPPAKKDAPQPTAPSTDFSKMKSPEEAEKALEAYPAGTKVTRKGLYGDSYVFTKSEDGFWESETYPATPTTKKFSTYFKNLAYGDTTKGSESDAPKEESVEEGEIPDFSTMYSQKARYYLESYPAGTKITRKMPNGDTHVYTKSEDGPEGKWTSDTVSGTLTNTGLGSHYENIAYGDTTTGEKITPPAKMNTTEFSEMESSEVAAMMLDGHPVGTKVTRKTKSGAYVFTKQEGGIWTSDTHESTPSSNMLGKFYKDLTFGDTLNGDGEGPEEAKYQKAPLSKEEFDSYPIGSVLEVFEFDDEYLGTMVKTSKGGWTYVPKDPEEAKSSQKIDPVTYSSKMVSMGFQDWGESYFSFSLKSVPKPGETPELPKPYYTKTADDVAKEAKFQPIFDKKALTSADDLDALPVGSLVYGVKSPTAKKQSQKKQFEAGGSSAWYLKTEDGQWVQAVRSVNAWKADKYSITAHPGSPISSSALADKGGAHVVNFDSPGQWYADVAHEMHKKLVDATSKPGSFTKAVKEIQEASAKAAQAPENKNLSVGSKVLTGDKIEAAIKGLEGHSGFQIAYGLKGLGADNPFSDKAFQDEVKALATAKFPTLKPKAAFVAYLKDKAGIPAAKDEKKDTGAKTILVGSKTPKFDTKQGFDGGMFSEQDVKEAIDLLEKFEGKAFKAYLNKQGNALGALDPSKIVGIHKDKTVAKQKFIDVLKGKLTVAPSEMSPSSQESVSDVDFDSLPVGTKVSRLKKSGSVVVYEKTDADTWQRADDGTYFGNPRTSAQVEADFNIGGDFYAGDLQVQAPNPEADKPVYAQKPVAAQKVPTAAKPSLPEEIPTSGEFDYDTLGPDTAVGTSAKVTLDAMTNGGTLVAYVTKTDKGWEGYYEEFGLKVNYLPKSVSGSPAEAHYISKAEYDSAVNSDAPDTPEKKSIEVGSSYPAGHFAATKFDAGTWWGKANEDDEAWTPLFYNMDGEWEALDQPLEVGSSKYFSGLANGAYFQKLGEDSAPFATIHLYEDGSEKEMLFYTKGEWFLGGEAYTSKELSDYLQDKSYVVHHGSEKHFVTKQTSSESKSAPDGLEPGKYTTEHGKAYMFVKADGTGIYVDTKGNGKAMTAAAVKKNHAAGMSVYSGMPDEIPTVTPVKKNVVPTVDKIPDGTYFGGDPDAWKTPVYEVSDGKIKMFTAAPSVKGSASKVGSVPNDSWIQNAPLGARIRSTTSSTVLIKVKDGHGPETWAKEATGEVLTPEEFSSYFPSWAYSYKFKILAHGPATEKEVTPAKAKTLFATGKFLDSTGTSVVPDGYTGAVSVLGSQTTIDTLFQVRDLLEKGFNPLSTPGLFKEVGFFPNEEQIRKQNIAINGASYWAHEGGDKILKDVVDSLLEGKEYKAPEGLGAEAFTFNEQGHATPSADAMSLSTSPLNKTALNAFIKAASEHHSGVIGLNPTKMSVYEAKSWYNAYIAGDFKKIYDLDVQAAGQPGAKPMLEGHKHPGSSVNPDTHQVTWSAAVEGEVPASVNVPGQWSGMFYTPSMAEIDNYLIAAQMQNPTYLSPSEKRQWVQNHRNNNSANVNALSLKAQARKQAGEATLSEPISWTDDVPPIKSYTLLFENQGSFPLAGWSYSNASDWFDDNIDSTPEMKFYVDQVQAEYEYSDEVTQKYYAVVAYMKAKADEEHQKSLIPVYTKKPIQSVKQGTHPISEWTDQFGNEFFFKPRPPKDKFRADIEFLGNQLGRHFGYSSAQPTIVEDLDGSYGLLQKKVSGVGDLMNADLGALTATQIGDIASEHVLDWFLDNDDSKGDNLIVGTNGRIVGIDKGRTFVAYGHWQGLTPGAMNTNAHTIYSRLFDDLHSGKISKETADVAYLQMQKKIRGIQKSDADALKSMITDAMKHRNKEYNVPYYIDGKKVPQTLDGLLQAIEHRRSTLDTDFEKLWSDAYKKAGYGSLPEAPAGVIDNAYVSLDSVALKEHVDKSKIHGISTFVSGASGVHGGSVHLSTLKNSDGENVVDGRFVLTFAAQDKVTANLKAIAVDAPAAGSIPWETDWDYAFTSFLGAAKTINHHSEDKQYNMSRIAAFEEAKTRIQGDLNAWSPDMPRVQVGDIEYVAFPSGTKVAVDHMGQYKAMLTHYLTASEAIDKAYAEQTKVLPHITQYEPVSLKIEPSYTKGSKKAVKTMGNTWLITDFETGEVTIQSAVPDSSWVKQETAKEEKSSKPYKVTYLSSHSRYTITNGKDGEAQETKTLQNSSAYPGGAYEVRLDTGEQIIIRNGKSTGTSLAQSGRVDFRIENSDDPGAYAASMTRIKEALADLGVPLDDADETDLEILYWREMADIFANRMSSDKRASAIHEDLKVHSPNALNKVTDAIAAKYEGDPVGHAQYYRDLFSKHFGAEKISEVISTKAYMPKYDSHVYSDPELETGQPYWERFDITNEELIASGNMLVTYSNSDANERLDMGGQMSAEERLRTQGLWNGNGVNSDQQKGSSHVIYMRPRKATAQALVAKDSLGKSSRVIYSPIHMRRTRAYSFKGDTYGELAMRRSGSPSDPLKDLEFQASSSETMMPNTMTFLSGIEFYIFDDAYNRQKAIDELKAQGIEMIRGLPIEDRLVMRKNLSAALAKIKETWK